MMLARARWPFVLLFSGACSFPAIDFEDGGGGTSSSGGSGGIPAQGGGTSSQGGGGSSEGGAPPIGGAPQGGFGGGSSKPTCIDTDDDGYLSQASDDACDELPEWAGKLRDCDDDDYYAHPDQATFFTVPRRSGGFDYNCTGGVETQYPWECPAACQDWLPVSPGPQGCGDSASLLTCNLLLGCTSPGTGGSLVQGCH